MNYCNEIRNELINNEINKKVKDYSKNKVELQTYYNVGKLLIEVQGGEEKSKYGNQLIKEYSIKLTKELGKGYGWRNLYNMRLFYLLLNRNQILQPLAAKLNWTQICIIMSLNDTNKINYYIKKCIDNNITKRELQNAIKDKEYERLPKDTKEKLINNDSRYEITSFIKQPILISNPNNIDIESIKEKVLQKLIIEDIENIMKQLGNGFCYIDKEYKIKLGNTYNYIDILLYNVIYHSYVVVELKVTKLKKEHIGQISLYMNYIDENLKGNIDNKTIGIIIVKENDEYIIKYSSDDRIKVTSFTLV